MATSKAAPSKAAPAKAAPAKSANAKSGGSVFAIGDNKVNLMIANQFRQELFYCPPAGFPNNVTDKKNFHYFSLNFYKHYLAKLETRVSRITVTFIWPG